MAVSPGSAVSLNQISLRSRLGGVSLIPVWWHRSASSGRSRAEPADRPEGPLKLQAGRELQLPAEVSGQLGIGLAEIRGGDAQLRRGPVHTVQGIEGVHANRQLGSLGDRELLGEREVEVLEAGSVQAAVIPRVCAPREGGRRGEARRVKPIAAGAL